MRRRQNRTRVMLASIGLSGVRSVLAARGASAEEEIEVVVTGTRTPESTQRAAVRTPVITWKEAERRGATNATRRASRCRWRVD